MVKVEVIGLPRPIDPKVWAAGEHYEFDGDVYVIAAVDDKGYMPIDIADGLRYSNSPVKLGESMRLLTQPGVRRLNVKKITVEVE